MSRRLVLSVEIPDDVDLADLGNAVRQSLQRAWHDDREDGRVRVDGISEALGGWAVVDVEPTTSVEVGFPGAYLVDRLTAVRLDDGRVQVVSEGGADPADPEATPDECFAEIVLPAHDARTVGLALASWALR